MSFSYDLKLEIATQPIKSSCCRKAFLDGIISSKASNQDTLITLNIQNDLFASTISKLITEFYGRVPEIRTPATGGRCREVSFKSKSAAKYIDLIKTDKEKLYIKKCESCTASFLKGVFFACGNISDPAKQYLLEFSPENNVDKILAVLEDISVIANSTNRRNKPLLYIKKSSIIEDFFAYTGMNSATFALMNAKIEGELRNSANRIANCETNNIGKAVTASHKHIMVIEELERAKLLSSLPEDLEKTARLRLEKRDLSLSQLAAVSVPAISKSGLSHRMNRIMELAAQLMPEIIKLTEK